MGKNHLKRIAMPKAWELARKTTTYITRPSPGAPSIMQALPLGVVLRDVLGVAKSGREIRYLIQQREVLVDGKRRKVDDLPVGPMDVVVLPQTKQYFRMLITPKGTLGAVEIPEAEQHKKLCRITGKHVAKGKALRLTLSGGRSISGDAKYAVGDSVLLELPKQKIAAHFALAEGATVYLIGGSHCGALGTVERIDGGMVHVRAGDLHIQAPRAYAFVVGKDKPAVTIS